MTEEMARSFFMLKALTTYSTDYFVSVPITECYETDCCLYLETLGLIKRHEISANEFVFEYTDKGREEREDIRKLLDL